MKSKSIYPGKKTRKGKAEEKIRMLFSFPGCEADNVGLAMQQEGVCILRGKRVVLRLCPTGEGKKKKKKKIRFGGKDNPVQCKDRIGMNKPKRSECSKGKNHRGNYPEVGAIA